MSIQFVFHPETFVSDIFTQMHLLLEHYTHDAYSALRDALKTPLAAAITLYYVIMGISVTYGWVEMSTKNLAKSAIKIGLIYTFSMNWDLFSTYFMNLVTSTMDVVSNATMHVGSSNHATGNVGDAVQSVLDNVWNLSQKYWKEATLHSPLPFLYGVVELVLGCLVLVLACGYLLVAEVMIALLFGFAPLFIMFMLFKPTQDFFNKWLGEITAQAMSVIFVSASLGMVLLMLGWAFPTNIKDINPAAILASIFVCLISFALLQQAAGTGRAIGSGIALYCQYATLESAKRMGRNFAGVGFAGVRMGGRAAASTLATVGKGAVIAGGAAGQAAGQVLKWWRSR